MAIVIRCHPCCDGKHWCMYVPGHKTDKKDSACICKLLRAGLLKGSFVPPKEQRELRDLTRYRRKLVQNVAAEHNRMIRVFEDANLKLSSVFSDVTVTGTFKPEYETGLNSREVKTIASSMRMKFQHNSTVSKT